MVLVPAVSLAYRVVYDVAETTPAWWFPAVGLVFVAIGLALWTRRKREWAWPAQPAGLFRLQRTRTLLAAFVLGFSLLWTVTSALATFVSHARAERALRDGTAHVVEGIVENFHPMPHSGHDKERFSVRGVAFAYSDFEVTPGFRTTASHGGPMREGLQVRIHYDGGREPLILRLEIAK